MLGARHVPPESAGTWAPCGVTALWQTGDGSWWTNLCPRLPPDSLSSFHPIWEHSPVVRTEQPAYSVAAGIILSPSTSSPSLTPFPYSSALGLNSLIKIACCLWLCLLGRSRDFLEVGMATVACLSFLEILELNHISECHFGWNLRQNDRARGVSHWGEIFASLGEAFPHSLLDPSWRSVSGSADSYFHQCLDLAVKRENQYCCYTLQTERTNMFSRAHFPISKLCWHFIYHS